MQGEQQKEVLRLTSLAEGHPALTPAIGLALAEAASVCLEEQEHPLEVSLGVSGAFARIYRVARPEVTEQMRLCYNDPEEATEWGACGIAILIVCDLTEWHIIERSRRGTGFDYWLGDADNHPFQRKARLEVSGIRVGDSSTIQARVRQKIRQTHRSDGEFPAYIAVVEFSNPILQVVQR